MVVVAVADAGAEGCALTVTVAGPEIQVISGVLRTKMVCEPADISEKVVEAW